MNSFFSLFSKKSKVKYHLITVDLMVLPAENYNYQIFEAIARRIHRETGWSIILGNSPAYGENDGKLHLKAEVPIESQRDHQIFLKGLAREYSKIITPFFK